MKIIVSLFLLLVSCTNHDSDSFNSLYSSFVDWSSKYTYSSSDLSSRNDLNKKFIGDDAYYDMKRFFIELNQINQAKLSAENMIKYELLSNYLRLNIIKSERIRYNEWNLIGLLNEIYELIFNLHLQTTLFADYKISQNHLYFIIDKINDIRTTIKYRYNEKYYFTYAEKSFDRLEKLLNIIDLSDKNFESLLSAEIKMINDWYFSDYKRYPIANYEISTQDYQRFFSTYNEQHINLDSILHLATKSLQNYEEKIIGYALPVYLSSNDEPIWTDFEDSLNVVNWVLNLSDNTRYDCKDKDTYAKELELLFLDKIESDVYFDVSSIKFDSLLSNNLISDYYKILDLIVPGDLYQNYLLSSLNNDPPTLFSVKYLNELEILSIDYYTDQILNSDLDLSLCNISDRDFAHLLKIKFFINRIEDSIESLALLHLYFGNTSINDLFSRYDRYGLLNNTNKDEILLKIYSLEGSGLSKFISYFNLEKKYIEENSDKLLLINLLMNNPNTNIQELGEVH